MEDDCLLISLLFRPDLAQKNEIYMLIDLIWLVWVKKGGMGIDLKKKSQQN